MTSWFQPLRANSETHSTSVFADLYRDYAGTYWGIGKGQFYNLGMAFAGLVALLVLLQRHGAAATPQQTVPQDEMRGDKAPSHAVTAHHKCKDRYEQEVFKGIVKGHRMARRVEAREDNAPRNVRDATDDLPVDEIAELPWREKKSRGDRDLIEKPLEAGVAKPKQWHRPPCRLSAAHETSAHHAISQRSPLGASQNNPNGKKHRKQAAAYQHADRE